MLNEWQVDCRCCPQVTVTSVISLHSFTLWVCNVVMATPAAGVPADFQFCYLHDLICHNTNTISAKTVCKKCDAASRFIRTCSIQQILQLLQKKITSISSLRRYSNFYFQKKNFYFNFQNDSMFMIRISECIEVTCIRWFNPCYYILLSTELHCLMQINTLCL